MGGEKDTRARLRANEYDVYQQLIRKVGNMCGSSNGTLNMGHQEQSVWTKI